MYSDSLLYLELKDRDTDCITCGLLYLKLKDRDTQNYGPISELNQNRYLLGLTK